MEIEDKFIKIMKNKHIKAIVLWKVGLEIGLG